MMFPKGSGTCGVNGDDPEAVLFVTQMAIDYRAEFNKDVVIDLICYPPPGDKKGEPRPPGSPMMYKKSTPPHHLGHPYATKLVEQGVLTGEKVRGRFSLFQDPLLKLEKPGFCAPLLGF
ncbi:MAG: hypothetical protein H0A75_06145 [Candidatus Methanofishera endochildressiae]|uniref:oxoglutarate dehydrogenase (succinyl-transferring) n=1 Tax=Candidatus Methanofishera endochildressiae TaxID=2738884 RepID=A0A7Z0MP05_9GAMM|nr:hypothetical protein [Candidatus Methanofishera endochildressiae]